MSYHIRCEPKSKICLVKFSWLACGEWSLLSPNFVLFVSEESLGFLFRPCDIFLHFANLDALHLNVKSPGKRILLLLCHPEKSPGCSTSKHYIRVLHFPKIAQKKSSHAPPCHAAVPPRGTRTTVWDHWAKSSSSILSCEQMHSQTQGLTHTRIQLSKQPRPHPGENEVHSKHVSVFNQSIVMSFS